MIAIVSAWEQELTCLKQIFSQSLQQISSIQWKHKNHQNYILTSLGVGYLEASIQLQKIVHECSKTESSNIEFVLFVGSAGIYPNVPYSVGELFLCKETILCDTSTIMGYSKYASFLNQGTIQSHKIDIDSLESIKIATLLSLTLDDQTAIKIQKKTNCVAENMELFGVARTCQVYGIPWNACVGITNLVGSSGSHEWKKNYYSVQKNIASLLQQELL